MGQLTLKYRYDESFFDARLVRDDFGWLELSVATDRFAGSGGFWVQWGQVREFGESLSAFPIAPDAPVSAEWGAGDAVILGVTISPANATGDLRVRVEIADSFEPVRRVCTTFLTHYPDIEAFGRAIARHMDGKLDEAILRGR